MASLVLKNASDPQPKNKHPEIYSLMCNTSQILEAISLDNSTLEPSKHQHAAFALILKKSYTGLLKQIADMKSALSAAQNSPVKTAPESPIKGSSPPAEKENAGFQLSPLNCRPEKTETPKNSKNPKGPKKPKAAQNGPRQLIIESSVLFEKSNDERFSLKPGERAPETTGEINLKILIQKESEIRSLRLKNDELARESDARGSKIKLYRQEIERLKRIINQSVEIRKPSVVAAEGDRSRSGKSESGADNFFGRQRKSHIGGGAAEIKRVRPLAAGFNDKKGGAKVNRSDDGDGSYEAVKNKEIAKKTEIGFWGRMALMKTPLKNKTAADVSKLKMAERSVSEPRNKSVKRYLTPKKEVKVKDDAILSAIKFKKTKSLFGGGRNKDAWTPLHPRTIRSVLPSTSAADSDFKASLNNKLDEAFLVLADKNEKWQTRVEKMQLIEEIAVKSRKKLSKDHLHLLKNVAIIQIYDPRSAVVRHVCKFLGNLSQAIPGDIDPYMGAYLNALFSRVYNSTGAIRDPCVSTIKAMVGHVANAKMVKELLTFTSDSHPETRALSIEMIGVCIDIVIRDKNQNIDKHRQAIERAISELTADANKNVRYSAKTTFDIFTKKWPKDGTALFAKLPASSKKLLRL